MDYQWFPGHMAKAIRQMKEDLKLIDLVIEIVDARIPVSSSNPILDDIAKDKPRLVVMNKSDMAQEKYNFYWKNEFEKRGKYVAICDSKNKKGLKDISSTALLACKEKIERNLRKGLKNKPIRAMVVGIPNVGKSTLINALSGKNVAKTGNKPGVTKGKQWIRLNKEIELLDTPGILWPKFEEKEIGQKIAFIGSINDDIIVTEELAYDLLSWIRDNQNDFLKERYEIVVDNPVEALEEIAKKRGCLLKGGKYDLLRASHLLLEDLRNQRLGKITLDREV